MSATGQDSTIYNPYAVRLMYLDESGKGGLHDASQPFHVLAGVIINAELWNNVETELEARIDAFVPGHRPDGWEIHMADISSGKKHFKGMAPADRFALADRILDLLIDFEMTVILSVVDKDALCAQYAYPEPPHMLCYEFVAERFQRYLASEGEVGMIIADEQRGAQDELQQWHTYLRRRGNNYLRKMPRIVDTVTFVPSHRSCMLQVADVVAWWCNRWQKALRAGNPIPAQWAKVEPRIRRGPKGVDGYGLKVFPSNQ